jgi:hypothetical protein
MTITMENLTPEQIQELVEQNEQLTKYKQETSPYMEHLVNNEKLLNAIADKKLDDSAVDRLFGQNQQQEPPKAEAKAEQVAAVAAEILTKEEVARMIEEKATERASALIDERLENDSELTRILSSDLGQYAEQAASLIDQYPNLESVDMEKVFLMAKAIEEQKARNMTAAEAQAEQERQRLASVAGGNGASSGSQKAYNPFGGASTTSGIF